MNSKYKLEVKGKNINQMVERIIKNNIYLYHIEKISFNKINIIVDEIGYKKLKKIKTSYNIKVLNLYGIKKYQEMLSKYTVFIVSILFSIVLLKVLSCVIFSVKVIHPKSYIRNIIIKDLEEYGIKKYGFKVGYKKLEKIKNKILKKEKNSLEWIEIENIGTSYVVKVEERIKNKKLKRKSPQHIIAKKDAMILNIEATHGEVVKKKYDYVKKGDVIISGIIMNKDTAMKKVKAQGKVYGEVWYKVITEIPKKYKNTKRTYNYIRRIEFKILNRSIFLFGNKYKNSDIKRQEIIKNELLPISINYSLINEIKVKKRKYNIDNIDSFSLKLSEEKLRNKLNKNDIVIYKKVLKKKEKNSKIIVEVFFKVKQDITDTENIEKIDIKNYKAGDKDGTDD